MFRGRCSTSVSPAPHKQHFQNYRKPNVKNIVTITHLINICIKLSILEGYIIRDQDFEIETLHFVAFLRKRDPIVALTAECACIQGTDDDDEWARLAIMPDPQHGSISMKTSYAIMQHHFEIHAPLKPTLAVRRIVHSNIPNRLDVVRIMGTSDEFVLAASREKKQRKKEVEKVEKDDDDPIAVAFREMKVEVKKEPKPKEEQHSDNECEDSTNTSNADTSEGSDSALEYEPEPPEPPEPKPPPPPGPAPIPVWEPTPGHIRIWLTRTGCSAECHGCGERIQRHEFRMLFHPDPKLNPDKRVWKKNWSRLNAILRRNKCDPMSQFCDWFGSDRAHKPIQEHYF